MKNDKEQGRSCPDDSCANVNARSIWMIGGAVVVLTSFFCLALFGIRQKPVTGQDPAQGVMVMGAGQQVAFQPGYPTFDQSFNQWQAKGQQVAFINPNCMTCPNFTQCFPQGTGAGQQIALTNPNCATCPNFTQCFPQGTGAGQQIALANPNCATCPNFTQCFPQGATSGQQVAAQPFYAGGGWPYSGAQTAALAQPVASLANSGPPIYRDAIIPHEFRGVCENCHRILRPKIPAIPVDAQAPHEYRGICSRCHTILKQQAGI